MIYDKYGIHYTNSFHSLIDYITITISFAHNTVSISFAHNTVSIRYSLSRYNINLRENQGSNQKWTIQRNRQEQSRMNNPQTQAGAIKNEQSTDTLHRQKQSRMDIPETQTGAIKNEQSTDTGRRNQE